MIIINLTGGLGNQMFQYAFGRYLSIKHKTKLKYHFTNALFNTQRQFSLNCFKIQAEEASSTDLKLLGVVQNRYINRILYLIDERYRISFNSNVVTQKYPYNYDASLREIPNNHYVQGYFADQAYFKGIEKELKSEFTLKNLLDKKNIDLINDMHSNNSIAVHVRRGDYITNKSNAKKIGFIGYKYYKDKFSKFKEIIQNPIFYVFSDDIDWCKGNLNRLAKNIQFIEHNKAEDSYKDMILMSSCKYHILANSTFSWWAKWLSKNPQL